MEPQTQEQVTSVHDINFQGQNLPFKFTNKVAAIFIGAVLLGVLSGFFISRNSANISTGNLTASGSNIAKGTVIGSDDTKTFKDEATGVLKTGGIDGEGAFHLVRPGGESQNVYLTSSIVDLSLIIDRKVKVWGETQKAQVAGWLMDVGRVEVLE